MANFSAGDVKELRERTGAGMMDCKRALEEADGNVEAAVALLRERGLAAAAKRAGREAREGVVASYIHPGGRVGVLIEVNCETDFVARTDEFQKLVRDLAMQVAGLAPIYVDVERIPEAELAAKRAALLGDETIQKKPEHLRPQIVEGQLKKWQAEVVPARAALPRHRPDGGRRSSPAPSPRSARTSASGASRGTRSARSCERPRPDGRRHRRSAGGPLRAHPAQDLAARRSSATAPTGSIPPSARIVATQVAAAHRAGVQVGLVVGGGNIFRGLAAARARDGPGDRRLHGDAGDRDERPRAPGRPRARRRADPGHDRDRHERGRRAVHPAAGDPPPREGPRHALRGRDRQPLLHDRHRRRAAGRRDRRRRSSSRPPGSTASTTPTR